MEQTQNIDYSAVLADLKRKRDEIDRAIAGIEVILGLSPSTQQQTPVGTGSLPEDAFFGLSIAEAAKKYLAFKKKPQTTQEIALALKAGGLQNQSENFNNTVGSVINRNVDGAGQIFARIGRGTFGLREWYPNMRSKSNKPGSVKNGEGEQLDPVNDDQGSEEESKITPEDLV